MILGFGELWKFGSESDLEIYNLIAKPSHGRNIVNNCLGVSPSLRLVIKGRGRDGDLTVLGEKDDGSLKSSLESEVFLNPLPHSENR